MKTPEQEPQPSDQNLDVQFGAVIGSRQVQDGIVVVNLDGSQDDSDPRLQALSPHRPNISARHHIPDGTRVSGLRHVDEVRKTISDRDDKPVGTPRSRQPTIPFEPLEREIGISQDTETEVVPLTKVRQEKIYQWQLKSKRPYDLIQRAEGRANPKDTYWGTGVRSGKNLVGSQAEVAAAKSSMGRAAIHNLYSKTRDHRKIAEERLSGSQRAKQVINWRGDNRPSSEDLDQLTDSLQELGNNIAANMDKLFPGGDAQARIAGNSVIALSEKIRIGEVVGLKDYSKLILAAVSNNLNQVALWKSKMHSIEEFSKEMGINLASFAA